MRVHKGKGCVLLMMTTLKTYTRRGSYRLQQLLKEPNVLLTLRAGGYIAAGFCLSAASLNHVPLPLSMGLVCACSGWPALLTAAGGSLGYLAFWGNAGYQGLCWVAAAFLLVLLAGNGQLMEQTPLLIPALAGLIVSATGVVFQTWLGERIGIGNYLLRIGFGAGSAWLFRRALYSRTPVIDWLCCGLGMLALSQLAPLSWLNFGFIAAGALPVTSAFPAAAIGGLALDLAQVCGPSMTAVLCGSYLTRFLPRYPRWLGTLAPASAYLLVGTLSGKPETAALPGLILGGILGACLPQPTKLHNRRGETGMAQVRLEMAASVLAQTEQILVETPSVPVDEDSLILRAAEQACSACPCRKNCKDTIRLRQLPQAILHKPLLTPEELPIICRKSGRLLAQLHRSQEQLRSIHADRQRQEEYRTAVVQQYRFLAEYLRELSDGLCRRGESIHAQYAPRVQIYANRPAGDNGDRCVHFPGIRCQYYVLLCDGMGTGLGAVQESKRAITLLRRLLSAGYPAGHALESLNSLCALRERAGIVTVELLEISLSSGRGHLYKWGAAPSYLLSGYGAEKIGTAGPPPGLSLSDSGKTAYQLSLSRGEVLLLVSDGISQDQALRCCLQSTPEASGDLARNILTFGQTGGEDDATVVTIHLVTEREKA